MLVRELIKMALDDPSILDKDILPYALRSSAPESNEKMDIKDDIQHIINKLQENCTVSHLSKEVAYCQKTLPDYGVSEGEYYLVHHNIYVKPKKSKKTKEYATLVVNNRRVAIPWNQFKASFISKRI